MTDHVDEVAREISGVRATRTTSRKRLESVTDIPEKAIDAARLARAIAANSLGGFKYGTRHVIRDFRMPPGGDQIWSIEQQGDVDYTRCHDAMMRELARLEMSEALAAALPHLASAQLQPNDDVWWWMRAPIDRLRIRAKDDHDLSMLIDAYDQSFKKAASVRAAALDECEAIAREKANLHYAEVAKNPSGQHTPLYNFAADELDSCADAIAALKRGPVAEESGE